VVGEENMVWMRDPQSLIVTKSKEEEANRQAGKKGERKKGRRMKGGERG
jgi:hypothetical protein